MGTQAKKRMTANGFMPQRVKNLLKALETMLTALETNDDRVVLLTPFAVTIAQVEQKIAEKDQNPTFVVDWFALERQLLVARTGAENAVREDLTAQFLEMGRKRGGLERPVRDGFLALVAAEYDRENYFGGRQLLLEGIAICRNTKDANKALRDRLPKPTVVTSAPAPVNPENVLEALRRLAGQKQARKPKVRDRRETGRFVGATATA